MTAHVLHSFNPRSNIAGQPGQARASCSSPDKCEFVCLQKNDSVFHGTSFCPIRCCRGSPPKLNHTVAIPVNLQAPCVPPEKNRKTLVICGSRSNGKSKPLLLFFQPDKKARPTRADFHDGKKSQRGGDALVAFRQNPLRQASQPPLPIPIIPALLRHAV